MLREKFGILLTFSCLITLRVYVCVCVCMGGFLQIFLQPAIFLSRSIIFLLSTDHISFNSVSPILLPSRSQHFACLCYAFCTRIAIVCVCVSIRKNSANALDVMFFFPFSHLYVMCMCMCVYMRLVFIFLFFILISLKMRWLLFVIAVAFVCFLLAFFLSIPMHSMNVNVARGFSAACSISFPSLGSECRI